ncbi:MAG TPA: type ISP restriction/modification enzyme [Pedobacter sp.]|jgi:predicted helicase
MSLYSIRQYISEIEKIIHFGGTKKETAIRNAFYNLLNEYAKGKGLMVVPEVTIKAKNSDKKVTPDGTLKDSLRQDWGYWESKDDNDNIDEEIRKKFLAGYPKENILFENSQTAVLFQNDIEIKRVLIRDEEGLHDLITTFISYERPEIRNFRQAIELFKLDIPKVTTTLRLIIEKAEKSNREYKKSSKKFLKLCHDSINPNVTTDDIREMIIQHILTEDVFNTIFDENQFHRENNIALELERVIHTFFVGSIRKTALSGIQHYYQAINAAAAGIADHHEKQKFLKVIYETFYKSYNPKAADRLGVVYTPNEVVKFMIHSTDYLLFKHFNKYLEDENVEILDPATGTGTFICDIIDYISKDKLLHKYKNELHANEVAILPYYISNLNIEFTYTQKMGSYSEFENLCFVDTLDNLGFGYIGKQIDMFAPFTEENSIRIKKQNSRKIAVIIGNPPYNANQLNENENNKNREYPEIDKRIKESFIKYSKAQKTKVYDMYSRFFRWAIDRLQNNGAIAFVTNRSFIDSRTFDGFRYCIQNEFDFAYIIDTKSDVRANPKIAGTTHNVFGIQTGIAIMFLIKKQVREKNAKCSIHYYSLPDEWRKEEKLQWLNENSLDDIPFIHIQPDKNNNWINITDDDYESLIPLFSKDVKLGKSKKAIFNFYSLGVATNRDEWVYDYDKSNLTKKVQFFFKFFEKEKRRWEASNKKTPINNFVDRTIKWTEELESHLKKGTEFIFDKEEIREGFYRPFVKKYLYFSKGIIHRPYQQPVFFPPTLNVKNPSILTAIGGRIDYSVFATDCIPNLAVYSLDAAQSLSLYSFDKHGNQIENISDWGLNQFIKNYKSKKITKWDVFCYVYAILHNPIYRKKYEFSLKREFPRIPFYPDFFQWSDWGKTLIELHIDYDKVPAYPLTEIVKNITLTPKAKLRADKLNNKIFIDDNTSLDGVPSIVWSYKLGNKSALEWVLDQYKETKPKDPTIADKFNKYNFSKYKTEVIDLIKKVTHVSIETMKIIDDMILTQKS